MVHNDSAFRQLLLETVIAVVPQWYRAEYGPHLFELCSGEERTEFYSILPLTDRMHRFFDSVQSLLESWNATDSNMLLPTTKQAIQESLILEWLRIHDGEIEWGKLLSFLKEVASRTFENHSVALNCVISKDSGTRDITDETLRKFLDPLAASAHVYLRLDPQLQLVKYDEVDWDQVEDGSRYRFNPELLQPFVSILSDEEYSAHVTAAGDIVIMNSGGILAACRKGRWRLYEADALQGSIACALGDQVIACNVFEIALDLSYRRKGALLVYDPDRKVVENIVSGTCIVDRDAPDLANPYGMLGHSVGSIALGEDTGTTGRKQRLLELSTMDGALIFDRNGILAFGAMITSHSKTGAHLGARTTAAYAAFHHGGFPIKVSADGEISVFFRSTDQDCNDCIATMEFV